MLRSQTQKPTCRDLIYMKCPDQATHKTESGVAVAMGIEEWMGPANGCGVSKGVMNMF